MRHAWSWLFAFSMLLLLPALAHACPQCAQNTKSVAGYLWMMGTMILLPFPVAGVVYVLIKRSSDDI